MTTIEQINLMTNYHQLKKVAKEQNIDILPTDKGKDIKAKILDKMSDVEVNEEQEIKDVENLQPVEKSYLTYTYVGSGEDSPQVIKFMGKVSFRRGEPTDIELNDTNKLVLNKLMTHKCFVEGSVTPDYLLEMDKKAKNRADMIRAEDRKIDQIIKKQYSK